MKAKRLLFPFLFLFCSSYSYSQNYALKFDGKADNATIPALNLNSNTVSFEAWIKPEGRQNPWSGIIVSEGDNNACGLIFRENHELGYMWEDKNGSRWSWSSGLVVPLDKWSHIALVVTPFDATLYLNGKKAVHKIKNDVKTLDGITRLGTDRGVADRFFKGLIDEVRIWNVSKKEEEIVAASNGKRLPEKESGLQVYYKMDNQSDSLKDHTSNARNAERAGTAYVQDSGINIDFQSSKSILLPGETFKLSDRSSGYSARNQREWIISGPDKLTDASQYPEFILKKPGVYDVTLIVSDGHNKDSVTRAGSIMVAENPSDRDVLYFEQKKDLLTASWDKPFGYESIKSNHAPLGPYMGNGDAGVVAFTSDNSQTLKISKVDFVTDGWSDWAGNGPAALPVGGVEIRVDSPVTSGFCYQMDQLGNELRMTTGTSQQVKMTGWMATNDNVIVMELTTTSEAPVPVAVDTYADNGTAAYATTAGIKERIAQVSRQTKSENVRWISQAGISTKILGTTPALKRLSDSKVRSSFIVSNSAPVRIAVYVSGGGKGNDAKLPLAYEKLNPLDIKGIERLKAIKTAWWKDMWQRSYVETNDELLNRHYLSSIYLLASAYNSHSPVCGGMYGVWNMEDQMMYHGDIHLNYNSQGGFYSAFSANRPEIAGPFYNFIESMVPEGKKRAKEDMGILHPSWKGKSCRGILFPVGALGIGVFYNYYWNQTMNAPFNVPFFSWYYEYTGDLKFLRDRAYPFIRECGDFYEDFMKKEAYGDSYRYTITTGAHEGSWDLNPPSDLGFVEQTFSLLLKYSKLLNVDAGRRERWQDILSHLPEYKVIMPTKEPNEGLPVYAKNEAGLDLPSHMIQLHPIYPCELLNLHSDPESLQIARNTIYYYGVSQNGFTGTMNELGLSAYVMAARVGFDPEIIIQKMKMLIEGAKPNFLIIDGHHCTEKTTVIETINSMVLQTVDDVLYLFPCWTKSPGSFTRLRAKGAFLVSADYDGSTVSNLKIFSEKGNICKLSNPWKGKDILVTEDKNPVSVEQADGFYFFATKEGKTYQIQPKDMAAPGSR